MAIKVLGKYEGGMRSVMPGDSVIVMLDGRKILEEKITRNMNIDTAIVFEFKDEFDLAEGIGGVLGKAKK